MTLITKSTSRRQITLPIEWRKKFSTDHFIIEEKNKTLIIRPINLKNLTNKKEYTVFDALRDNHGKGVKADDLIKVLKKIK